MTIENQVYGVPHWVKCSNCGVTRPPTALKAGKCTLVAKCAEWKATLYLATMEDLRRAADQLVARVWPTPDQLLAEMLAKPFVHPRRLAKRARK